MAARRRARRMAAYDFHWERRTEVPPAKALAWWFDLQPEDHDSPEHRASPLAAQSKPGDGRTVVERRADEVVARDRWRGFEFPSVVRKGAGQLTYDIGQGSFRNRSTLRFQPDGAGTRLVYDSHVEAKGLFGLLLPLMRRRNVEQSGQDMELHARHMEREWREQVW